MASRTFLWCILQFLCGMFRRAVLMMLLLYCQLLTTTWLTFIAVSCTSLLSLLQKVS